MPSPKFALVLVTALYLSATAVCAETRADAQKAEAAGPASDEPKIDDGPYVHYRVGRPGIEVAWICQGRVIRKTFARAAGAVIKPACGYAKTITIRDDAPTFPVPAKFSATKLLALSDVHGQFDTMVRLLQANGVIDQNMKWSYGNGHVVMIGDMFDRGPHVTEVLWLLYQLEMEAIKTGGRVHVLLGNHETMLFYDDLRYLNPKYVAVAKKLDSAFPALFDENTVLGRWLRAKPTLLQVNDMLFVHGGLGTDYAALKLSVTETNEAFRNSLGQPRTVIRAAPLTELLYGTNGPVWYRGYFRDPIIESAALDNVLAQYAVKHVVVGHTPFSGVFSHYDGRVISVDSAIQKGVGGEVLIWNDGKFARGSSQGEQSPLPAYTKGTDASER